MDEEKSNKKCRCGYKLGDPWVVPKEKYSFWGWLIVSFGVSHPPIQVWFECDKCGEVFYKITDKQHLKSHAYK